MSFDYFIRLYCCWALRHLMWPQSPLSAGTQCTHRSVLPCHPHPAARQLPHHIPCFRYLQCWIISSSRTILIFLKNLLSTVRTKDGFLKQSLLIDIRLLIQRKYFIYYLEGLSLKGIFFIWKWTTCHRMWFLW